MESGGLDQEGEPIIRRRTIAGVVVASLAVSLSVGLMSLGPVQQPRAAQPERGFSIVSLQPDVAQSLRAQGKQISYPSPSTANKGKKFNPGGDTITQLVTAPKQNVLVLFCELHHPASRRSDHEAEPRYVLRPDAVRDHL